MRCIIEKCPNNTEAVSGLCLEHECVVWAIVEKRMNGGRAETKTKQEQAAAKRPSS